MKINRPKIPTESDMMGFLGFDGNNQNFAIWDFLSSTAVTGIPTFTQNQTGWHTVFTRPIVGWADFLCFAGKNSHGSANRTLGYNLTIDDVLISQEFVAIPPGVQGGISKSGTVCCTEAPPRRVKGVNQGYLPYNRIMLEVFNEDATDLDVVVAVRLFDQNVA